MHSPEEILQDPCVIEAFQRGIVELDAERIVYNLGQRKSYNWGNPEEWVRVRTIAWLVVERDYPALRMLTEVVVPRRTPTDRADVVVYRDDRRRSPYLVVENKAAGQSETDRRQGIEQGFGNANSMRAELLLYDELETSYVYDVASHDPLERELNRLGDRDALPRQYGDVPEFRLVAGTSNDIEPARSSVVEARIRRAHSIIWAGGRRDPLTAFDEWSKLLFAKVADERRTPTGEVRHFQVGAAETTAAVANRVHDLFGRSCRDDPTIFPPDTRIQLPDSKISDVVESLQDLSFTRTDVDSVGRAFEEFFGSVFRGELGQYFTMRQLARFTVAMLDLTHEDYVIDPSAGSGGFLLEALLQVWRRVDRDFSGQSQSEIERIKLDFALHRVFGIEIHEILARICKINLLLHHDGHTNIESDRSCLDSEFTNPRLNPPRQRFTRVVGNPPFGDEVKEGDEDHLGSNSLSNFEIAEGRNKVASEHVILERSVALLEPNGRLGLVVPDGLLNNQGSQSNCPQTRMLLAKAGRIEAVVSLPDYAFRKSGAQNKTSILFFRKFSRAEKRRFDRAFASATADDDRGEAISEVYDSANLKYQVFLAEANIVGYTTTGAHSNQNDLYAAASDDGLADDQSGTILGEYRRFLLNSADFDGSTSPDCMAMDFVELWRAHASHRLDPKYHLFRREEARSTAEGWIQKRIGEVMRRREEEFVPQLGDPERLVTVMTIAQTGEIRPGEAGKGRNPPEWRAVYFEESPGTWYAAHGGDFVFSSIDLWKGCIAVVPDVFDGALVTKEFPIYEITEERLDPEFLSCLLRSRYYQRAFRAITTGHSNRRRTQVADFESLEISFPPDRQTQRDLIRDITQARKGQKEAGEELKQALREFSDQIDDRRGEELYEIQGDSDAGGEENLDGGVD